MQAYELKPVQSLDSLTLVERPDPRPGPGQVLIALRAWSLNYRDLMVAKGAYGAPPPAGRIPLSDGAGEVVEVGPGGTRLKPGDRVAGCFMQGWIAGAPTAEVAATALGGAIDGMLAEYVVLSEQGVVRVPEHLSDEEAATLPCAAVTAWNALVREARVKAGDVVVLQGTGGVSLFALQFAKLHGARCIITSSSDDKLALARQLGADDLINYKRRPDWDKAVLELTDGRGADVVVEVGGAGTLEKSLAAVRYAGIVTLIGVLTGTAWPDSDGRDPAPPPARAGHLRRSREMLEEMNRASTGCPHIDRGFSFDTPGRRDTWRAAPHGKRWPRNIGARPSEPACVAGARTARLEQLSHSERTDGKAAGAYRRFRVSMGGSRALGAGVHAARLVRDRARGAAAAACRRERLDTEREFAEGLREHPHACAGPQAGGLHPQGDRLYRMARLGPCRRCLRGRARARVAAPAATRTRQPRSVGMRTEAGAREVISRDRVRRSATGRCRSASGGVRHRLEEWNSS
jgi:NADPH:quinone reductase-like Zn-dependent oxidoreductase